MKKYGKPEIFNTDQGTRFTSEEFTPMLRENDIRITNHGAMRFMLYREPRLTYYFDENALLTD